MRKRVVLVVLLVLVVLAVPGGLLLAPSAFRKVIAMVKAALGRPEVFAQVRDEVVRQLEELRPDLTDAQRLAAGEILGAQAVVETNGGKTVAWRQGWNWGNVTAGSTWTGGTVIGGDTEPDAAGNYVPITQTFRKYGSLADGVSDFLTGVLNWRRERAENVSGYLYAGDAEGYAAALRRAGYFTAPLADYTAGILSARSRFA